MGYPAGPAEPLPVVAQSRAAQNAEAAEIDDDLFFAQLARGVPPASKSSAPRPRPAARAKPAQAAVPTSSTALIDNVPPDADRYAHLAVELACPKCGSGGLFPWRQLDRILFCNGCQVRYRVEPGRLVELTKPVETRVQVQVRTNSSAWKDHLVRLRHPRSLAHWLADAALGLCFSRRGLLLASSTLAVLVSMSMVLWNRKPDGPAKVEIPDALEGRAAVFSEAAARRDMGVLIALTDPGEHRALRIWLAHGSELPQPAAQGTEAPALKAEILSTALAGSNGKGIDPERGETNRAEVQVRLSGTADGKDLVLNERWVQRNAKWYFQPVRVRTPPPTAGPVRPQRKATRHR